MNRAMLTGTVLGVVVATAGGAIAGYSMLNHEEEYADVVSHARDGTGQDTA
jgi:uncharacterized protein YcfJ